MAVVLTLEICERLFLLTNSYALLRPRSSLRIIVNILLFHISWRQRAFPIAAIVVRALDCERPPYRALLSPLFQRRFDDVERAESLVSRGAPSRGQRNAERTGGVSVEQRRSGGRR